MKDKKLDVIWTLTRVCPYKCKVCCVNAPYSRDTDIQNKIKEHEKNKNRELCIEDKLRIVDDLASSYKNKVNFDFSGGDPLIFEEDRRVIAYASKKVGKENVMISSTGWNFDKEKMDFIKKYSKYVELTIDKPPWLDDPMRPLDYNLDSLIVLDKCRSEKVPTGMSTVLRNDIPIKELEKLNNLFKNYNLKTWHLLRLHLAGRAKRFPELIPTEEFYEDVARFAQKIKRGHIPSLHHSFRKECQALKDMIGILADGSVLACCWALNEKGFPLNEKHVLGKLPEQKLSEVLNNKKTSLWYNNKPCATDQCIERAIEYENQRDKSKIYTCQEQVA